MSPIRAVRSPVQVSITPPDARITGLPACPGLISELIENTETCDKQTITAREDSDDEFLGLFSPRPGAAGDDANGQDVNDTSSQPGYSSLMLAQRLTSKKSENQNIIIFESCHIVTFCSKLLEH